MSEENSKKQNANRRPSAERKAAKNTREEAVNTEEAASTATAAEATPIEPIVEAEIEAALPRPSFESSEFIVRFLDAHNEVRKQHRCHKLELDNQLSLEAETIAKKILENEPIDIPKSANYGMNVYESNDHLLRADDVVKQWYDEIDKFDFENPQYSEETKHFVQLVWRDTKEIGFSTARSVNKVVVVALYRPAGNIENLMDVNVPRKSSGDAEDENSEAIAEYADQLSKKTN